MVDGPQDGLETGTGVPSRGRVLATTTGFVVPRPVSLMHCDTLQIFTRGYACVSWRPVQCFMDFSVYSTS
jgi:hypothetical protein